MIITLVKAMIMTGTNLPRRRAITIITLVKGMIKTRTTIT